MQSFSFLTAGRDARLPPPLNRVALSKSDTSTLLTRSLSPLTPPPPPLNIPPWMLLLLERGPVAPPPSENAEKTSSPPLACVVSGVALSAMPNPARAWLLWRRGRRRQQMRNRRRVSGNGAQNQHGFNFPLKLTQRENTSTYSIFRLVSPLGSC